jgi:hypothetical protein
MSEKAFEFAFVVSGFEKEEPGAHFGGMCATGRSILVVLA